MASAQTRRPRSATIRDVAELAGVSVSTVSLALNTPQRVADATRERVLAAADELGFVPKAQAVASARRGVGRVGVVGPFGTYTAASRRLAGILRAATPHALEVVVFEQESSAHKTAPLLASLPRTGRLDGLLIVSLPLDDAIVARIDTLGLPTVLVDGRHRGLSSVRTDDHEGGRLAAEHLLERKHRRFAYLGEAQRSRSYVSPAQHRLDGYRAAVRDAGRTLLDAHCVSCAHDLDDATRVADQLLNAGERPTAIFASDDLLAAGALAAARHHGLRVPEDLAVMGFDDGELAQALGLTTIAQPLEATGQIALEHLSGHLKGSPPVQETVLELALTARDTT